MCNIGNFLGMLPSVSRGRPVLAYRNWSMDGSWSLDGSWNPYGISSLFSNYNWKPEWQESGFPLREGMITPTEDNYMGFFAFTRPWRKFLRSCTKYHVKGIVRLAGDIAVHERGMRAQYAQPAAFLVPRMSRALLFGDISRKDNRNNIVSLREGYPEVRIFRSATSMILWRMRQSRTVPSRRSLA